MKQAYSFNEIKNTITAFDVFDECIFATTSDVVYGFKRNGQSYFKTPLVSEIYKIHI